MKKLVLAIVAIVYLGISSGIAMDVHYCMGQVSQVDFFIKADHKCCDQQMGCCGEKYKFYKLSKVHTGSHNTISIAPIAVPVITKYYSYNWCYAVTNSSKIVTNNSPPIYTSPSACILNCSFRI